MSFMYDRGMCVMSLAGSGRLCGSSLPSQSFSLFFDFFRFDLPWEKSEGIIKDRNVVMCMEDAVKKRARPELSGEYSGRDALDGSFGGTV